MSIPLLEDVFQGETLIQLLSDRATHQTDQTAYIFLKDGTTESGRLTYGELAQQAQAIAIQLQTLVAVGDRALLVYPYSQGLEFITAFLGCLWAGVIAVPMSAPSGNVQKSLEKLEQRVVSSQATLVLSTTALTKKLKGQLAQRTDLNLTLAKLPWLSTSDLEATQIQDWQPPTLTKNSLAFLQYTSGSTGIPKGVMVSHGNILANQKMIQLAFQHTEQAIGGGWLPLFHDMGLIGNVLQPLYMGFMSVLMSPMTFILKPYAWLQAISRYRITSSGAPNFAYDLLCRQVTPQQRETLDLSCWTIAFSGAEPIKASTLNHFSELFAPCGFRPEAFYPCYGMAEATLFITGGERSILPKTLTVEKVALEQNQVVQCDAQAANGQTIVSCGTPRFDNKILIVNPENQCPCSSDQVGEIWVAGSGIAGGYWDQFEDTAKTFQVYTEQGEGPFLRTGDLGFIQDGELYVTGRWKEVLIFNGLNRYPQHLEQTVEKTHPAFRPNCGAAFSINLADQEKLVIVYEIERHYRQCFVVEELAEKARWALAQEHYVDLYSLVILDPGGLPKTSSGKIQRRRCRAQFLDGSLSPIATWTSSTTHPGDLRSLLQQYLNPLTHARRYRAIAKGQLKRFYHRFL